MQDDSGSKSRTVSRVGKAGFVCPFTGADGKGKCALFSYAVTGT